MCITDLVFLSPMATEMPSADTEGNEQQSQVRRGMGDEGGTVFSDEIRGRGERRSAGKFSAASDNGSINIESVGSYIWGGRGGGGRGDQLPGQGRFVGPWRAKSARAGAQT